MRYQKSHFLMGLSTELFYRPDPLDLGVPKESGRMTERERAVCARVKTAREDIKWPQEDFAKAIGLSKDKLASIEYARTPLRYKVGVDLCEVFGVSAEWLITGQGETHGGAPILWEIEFPFEQHGKRLFTEVYDLAPNVFCHVTRVFDLVLDRPTPGFDGAKYLTKKVAQWFRRAKFRSPTEAEAFARFLNDRGEQMLLEFQKGGKVSQERLSKIKADHEVSLRNYQVSKRSLSDGDKDNLDTGPKVGIVGDVKVPAVPTWPQLRKLIAEQTGERGAKAALADKLGVSRQVLNNWLASGEQGAPNAETTLKLLAMFWRPAK